MTHARHAAHAAAWRVPGRAATDRRVLTTIAAAGRVGDGTACGTGRDAGRRAELDRRIEEKVRGEVERMEWVARRVLCDISY